MSRLSSHARRTLNPFTSLCANNTIRSTLVGCPLLGGLDKRCWMFVIFRHNDFSLHILFSTADCPISEVDLSIKISGLLEDGFVIQPPESLDQTGVSFHSYGGLDISRRPIRLSWNLNRFTGNIHLPLSIPKSWFVAYAKTSFSLLCANPN